MNRQLTTAKFYAQQARRRILEGRDSYANWLAAVQVRRLEREL